MQSTPQTPKSPLSFDQHVDRLPDSKQSIHWWVSRLIIVAFLAIVGLLAYAIYASVAWKSVGEANVVLAWLYFFLAGAATALLMGLDELIVGATLPPPLESAKYSFQTGRRAIQEGWTLVALGALVIILAIIGLLAVRAGSFGLENWVTLVAGFWAVVGLGALALALIRRVLRLR